MSHINSRAVQCYASWHFVFQQVEEQYEVLGGKYPLKFTSYNPLATVCTYLLLHIRKQNGSDEPLMAVQRLPNDTSWVSLCCSSEKTVAIPVRHMSDVCQTYSKNRQLNFALLINVNSICILC